MDDRALGIRPRQLKQFVTLVDCRDFGLAADALNTTPRSLAKAVRELERDAGEPLLAPSARRVTLTPAGELLLQSARRVLVAVDRFAEIAREDGSVLRVAHVADSDTMSLILAELIARDDSLPVRELMVSAHRQLQALQDHRLDVAVCVVREHLPHELEACPLRLDPLLVATPRCDAPDALVDGNSPLLAATYGAAWPAYDAVVNEYARVAGCPLTRVAVPAGTGRETAALLREARGRRALVAASTLGDRDVVTTLLTPAHPYLRWSLVWRRDDPSETVQAFVRGARELSQRSGWLTPAAGSGHRWLAAGN